MSGVRISGRQFFPCEGVSQTEQMFDVTFTITATGINIDLVIYGYKYEA
jgi:hypothetical protein